MEWLELSKDKSKKEYDYYNSIIKDDFSILNTIESYNDEYKELKKDIYKIFYDVVNELQISVKEVNKSAYKFDYRFALKLYYLLNDKYKFNQYLASNNGIWRYIQVKICPYLIYLRWGNNAEHLYSRSSRIWLKSLWWYIHLAWNKNEETTIEVLKNNNSDTFVQLVERTGKYGYRIELYKEILYKRCIYNVSSETFRKIMILNTMRVKVIDPYLVNGGIPAYVDELYKDALMEE